MPLDLLFLNDIRPSSIIHARGKVKIRLSYYVPMRRLCSPKKLLICASRSLPPSTNCKGVFSGVLRPSICGWQLLRTPGIQPEISEVCFAFLFSGLTGKAIQLRSPNYEAQALLRPHTQRNQETPPEFSSMGSQSMFPATMDVQFR